MNMCGTVLARVRAHERLIQAIDNLNFQILPMPYMYESWGSSPIGLHPDKLHEGDPCSEIQVGFRDGKSIWLEQGLATQICSP